MAGQIQFNRTYAQFGAQVKEYEKSDDVGFVVTEFLWFEGFPFYPISSLIDAKITGIWLGEGERPAADTNNIDLIFKMAGMGEGLYEIGIRVEGDKADLGSDDGTFYGGWYFGDTLEVTDDIVAGHRVVIGSSGGEHFRFEFDPSIGQYRLVETAGAALSTSSARKSVKAMRRR